MFLGYLPLWNIFRSVEPVPLAVTAVPSPVPSGQEILQPLDGPLGPCPSLTHQIDGRARHGHSEQPYQ